MPPALLAGFVAAAPQLGATGQYLVDIFGGFDFEGTEPEAPTRTFDGSLTLTVGDRDVELLELGPAHTGGDVAVHVPDAGVVYTGDLVFHGGHPIVWAGPVANWMAACDRLLALDAATVVPGHGPIGDRQAVEDQRGYFEWLVAEGTPRLGAGMSPLDAALDLAGGPYDGWGEPERLVANLIALSRDLGRAPAGRRHHGVRLDGIAARSAAVDHRSPLAGELHGAHQVGGVQQPHRARSRGPRGAARPPPGPWSGGR